MADKPYRGHRADLTVYDDYAGPLTEEKLEQFIQKAAIYTPKPPQWILTKSWIEWAIEKGLISAETVNNSSEYDISNLLECTYKGINYSPKLFLTEEEIEYFLAEGYPIERA